MSDITEKREKRYFWFRSASLKEKAKDSWPQASSPAQRDVPPTSIRVMPPIIPLFQYSSWAETPEFDFSGILSGEERVFQKSPICLETFGIYLNFEL